MKPGQKAILVNLTRLEIAGLGNCVEREIILQYQDKRSPDRWWFKFLDPPKEWSRSSDYWAYTECIQLLPQTDWGNWMVGDKAVLTDGDTLRKVCMGAHEGKTVTLRRRMAQTEKENRSFASNYMHEDVWWIVLPSNETPQYYVPARCLKKPEQQQLTVPKSYELGAISYVTTTQKETDSMTMYQVAIVSKPSVLAQQAGAVDKIVVQPTTVMAIDEKGAIAQIAAENAADILALKDDKASISVCTKRFTDC